MFERFFGYHLSAKKRTIKPVVLIILDGWGVAPPSQGNVIAQAKTPNFDCFFKEYPHTDLIAAGESVGLPANEVGSTEVGHLTIGAGRVILQGLKRINAAIEDGSFFNNPSFLAAVDHVRKNNSKLHIIGIVSSGKVHGSIDHFYALLELCGHLGLNNVYLHIFTDGRDAPPHEAKEILDSVSERLALMKVGTIATISGRYYAMDRDRRWDRVQKVYEAMVEGKGNMAEDYHTAIDAAYQKGFTDELIEPTVITKDGKPIATIDDNDAAIFFNYRIDRPKELTMALTLPDFEEVDTSKFGYTDEAHAVTKSKSEPTFARNKVPKNLFFVSMMNYHKNIPVQAVAFDTDIVPKPFSEIVADSHLSQLHMAESEKERFVSYYFDGYREDVYPNEKVVIVPSPRVPTYDKKPAMSTFKLVSEIQKGLEADTYHFIVMNIAAPDMVAHTGNIPATIKACEATDKAVGEIIKMVLQADGTAFITADHGHAEKLLAYPSSSYFFTTSEGSMSTDHSNNPVPLIVISNALKNSPIKMPKGSLSDIVVTILHYMKLPIPDVMTGRNLLE